jgi:hypothetical protein
MMYSAFTLTRLTPGGAFNASLNYTGLFKKNKLKLSVHVYKVA